MTAVMPEPTDLLVVGADIVTQWAHLPRAEALGVRGGRVVAVGTDQEVREALGPRPRVWDLGGHTVIPGFVDGHCHLEMTCEALDHHVFVQVPPLRSVEELMAAVARARADRPTGWLVCRSSFMLQDKVIERRLPDRHDLDRVSPDQPVVLLAGLHVACLNTAALRLLDLPDEPPRGMTVHRDGSGELTGVVTEVWDRLPTQPTDEVVASLRRHLRPQFVANGVTTVCTIPTSADDVRALHRLARSGELPLRVRYYVHVPRTATLDEVLSWGPSSGFGDEWVSFGGVKIFVDGEGGDGLGHPLDDTKWTPAELFDLVARADRADVQLFMHAVTPGAIRFAAQAVEAARAERGRPDGPRHRIEHGGDYLDPADIPLLRRSGVQLVATPHFSRSAGVADAGFQPLRTIVDAGIPLIGGSDSTGTVPDGLAPLTNMAAAVERVDADGKPSPHRLTVQEALDLFTTSSAHGAHLDSVAGVLRPGAWADLAVLSADPLDPPSGTLDTVRVLATAVGGVLQHDELGVAS